MEKSIKMQMYSPYFRLSVNHRINERQLRNALNINHLFSTVVSQCNYTGYTSEFPVINNGMYHHIGKNHSQYPTKTKTKHTWKQLNN